jgi:alpha-L-rhamnosidase
MNSFNHYAYGAVGAWMYETIGGIHIDPTSPGYQHVLIQVQPGGGITHASAVHESPYGRLSSDWTIDHGRLTLSVLIPANSSAMVRFPKVSIDDVREHRARPRPGDGILGVRQEAADAVVEIGAGRYSFTYPVLPATAGNQQSGGL